jgi:hypothetical protein
MQAKVRGFLSRKDIKRGLEMADARPKLSNRSRGIQPGYKIMMLKKGKINMNAARELQEMPEVTNVFMQQTEARLGPFQYTV